MPAATHWCYNLAQSGAQNTITADDAHTLHTIRHMTSPAAFRCLVFLFLRLLLYRTLELTMPMHRRGDNQI